MNNDKIIIGIDPGTNVMGYGVIELINNDMKLISAGVIELSKFADHYMKLGKIYERVLSLIDQYHPDELAVESPFFGKNVQSMLKLGRAQGVAIAAALARETPVFEYSPKKIKQSITGNGNASKEQVAAMLQTILQFDELPKYLDATDGLAAAVCHYFQNNREQNKQGSYSNWKAFITENPGRKL